jgi:hypothetical protein
MPVHPPPKIAVFPVAALYAIYVPSQERSHPKTSSSRPLNQDPSTKESSCKFHLMICQSFLGKRRMITATGASFAARMCRILATTL